MAAAFRLTLVLLAALGGANAEADPLRDAILTKPLEQLKTIVDSAGIALPEGADASDVDVLRAAIYEHAQQEKPAHLPRYRWDGSEMPKKSEASASSGRDARPEAAAANSGGGDTERRLKQKTSRQLKEMLSELKIAFPEGADKAKLLAIAIKEGALARYEALPGKATLPKLEGMAAAMFKSLDRNLDGKLSREEMAPMIEKTNAMAAAKGESIPGDFFASLDINLDGSVDRAEANTYFKRMMDPAAAAGAAAAPSAGAGGAYDHKAIFKALDKDANGKLTRDELKSIIEQANANNKERGDAPVDFFATMDADGDGEVDPKEGEAFFKEMIKMAQQGAAEAKGGAHKSEL